MNEAVNRGKSFEGQRQTRRFPHLSDRVGSLLPREEGLHRLAVRVRTNFFSRVTDAGRISYGIRAGSDEPVYGDANQTEHRGRAGQGRPAVPSREGAQPPTDPPHGVAKGNDEPREPRIPPEVRGAIAKMEETLVGHPDDGGKASLLARSLWSEGKISSYADFEQALRAVGSRMYFIAYPQELLPPGDTISYPDGCISDAGDPRFVLFTAHKGAEQAELMRLELGGVSIEENLRRLKLTGRIVIPSERKLRDESS